MLQDPDKAVIRFRESTIAEDVRRQSLGMEALCLCMERALSLSPADRPTADTLASHLTQLDSKLMIDFKPLIKNEIDSVAAFRISDDRAAVCMVASKNASFFNLHFATFSADGGFRAEHVSQMLPSRNRAGRSRGSSLLLGSGRGCHVCCLGNNSQVVS